MIPYSEIRAAGYEIAVSSDMMNRIYEWGNIYENRASWLVQNDEKHTTSLQLPSGIASELARLTLYNGKSWIGGKGNQEKNMRSEWLQDCYSRLMKKMYQELEIACATGGMVFKPYVIGEKIYIDAIPNDRFIPCAFDLEGNITEAVFLSTAVMGKNYYTRLEHHRWQNDFSYVIENRIFRSSSTDSLGTETDLSEVPQWSGIRKSLKFRNIKQPLFSYFKLPVANNVDRKSLIGISCYARAVNQIRQADEQWERIMWEYQGSELAIMAETGMFRIVKNRAELPSGKERLYRIFQDMGDKEHFHEFAPDIRDSSLFNGLNRIFQRIEFNCGLAYGIISDPQLVEKTAEEVRSSKQRSLTYVRNIQSCLEDALKSLVCILDDYADICGLADDGEYEIAFEWGDGVSEDHDKEFARRLQLATAGKYKWEHFLAWHFGCSVEKAAELIPENPGIFGDM